MDDIFLATQTTEEHKILLKILFRRLLELNLMASIHKSFIGKSQISLLGMTIKQQKIEVQEERIYALNLFPPPATVRELWTMMEAFRYISNYVPQINVLA